jgi:hypothetical protein
MLLLLMLMLLMLMLMLMMMSMIRPEKFRRPDHRLNSQLAAVVRWRASTPHRQGRRGSHRWSLHCHRT